MNAPRKISVVTGSRADYGLLHCLIDALHQSPDFQLQLVVTGMHMSPHFGLTLNDIVQDGFPITAKVPMLVSGDDAQSITKSLGLGVIGFADTWQQLQPDIIMVLGDRYEILAAAQAAMIFAIPLAHIAGGDTTQGAFDEAIRHSITKMSHLHFVTNHQAAKRVQQLGENPETIYNVGSPGIDNIKQTSLLTQQELETSLSFTLKKTNFLITYHPETLAQQTTVHEFNELLAALATFDDSTGLIFTQANADNAGAKINALLENFVSRHANAIAFVSLGAQRYYSALSYVDAVIGNSSSGLYEAPTFHKPTINIGQRQAGRLAASSVLHCDGTQSAILSAIAQARNMDCSTVINPYGDGKTCPRIISILKTIKQPKNLLKKVFFDYETSL